MIIFFGTWIIGTIVAVVFLEGPWQFVAWVGSAWLGIWINAWREDEGTRWSDERAKRSGETRGG